MLFEHNGATRKQELKGGEPESTNSRMEITAAIQALKSLDQSYNVECFTDSQYLQKGITEWMLGWRKTNFKKGKILNSDLWKLLDEAALRHEIEWKWVRGHSSNEHNERADTLASIGRAETLGRSTNEQEIEPYRLYLNVSIQGAWAVLIDKGNEQTILSGFKAQETLNHFYLVVAVAAFDAIVSESMVFYPYIQLVRG